MSYFHGIPITSVDSHSDHSAKRKHKKEKHLETDLKLPSETKHRKRRSSSVNKTSTSSPHDSFKSKSYDQLSSPKCKTGRHLSKEIDRLVEENRILGLKLKEKDSQSKESELNEKEILLNKLHNKYCKLEKNYSELQTEHNNLTKIFEDCKKEYNGSNRRLEESAGLINYLEQERNNLLTTVNVLKSETSQYTEDIALLKNVIFRLNVELERYQDKLREIGHVSVETSHSSRTDDKFRGDDGRFVLESWGKVNLHALGPLLDAYTENLHEKEELIAQYKREIDLFSGNCKEIVTENEILIKSVENLKEKCKEYVEEIKVLEEDAIVIKEQNDLLVKQVNLQKQKVQEIHSIYEQKVESMSKDNNKLHKEYLACKTELSNIKGKYEILNDGYEKLKNNCEKTMPISVHASAVDECKRLFEELKTQYDTERKKLNARIKLLEDKNQENEKLIFSVTVERDQLKLHVKTLEKSLKKISHKLECFQNTAYSMQVSRDLLKRQLSKTTAFCEELVFEQENLIAEKDRLFNLLKEKEKETEDIQFLGDNITQRMGTLKSQLKNMQKGAEEQLATVEKQIKMQELNVDQMKAEHRRELQKLHHIIKQKDEIIRKLQNERSNTQGNLELVLKTATNDGIKVKDAMKSTKMYKNKK